MTLSRRSSKKSSNKFNITKVSDTKKYSSKPVDSCFISGIIIIIQGSILYYLYNLEGSECNCIRDWRHNFIKGMSIINIILSSLVCLRVGITFMTQLTFIIGIATLINFYAFFTYVGELNKTKCICAIDKQPILNNLMNILRWIQFFTLGMVILLCILLVIIGVSIIQKIKNK